MIFDSIKNIQLYKEIPDIAVDFIQSLDCNTELGRHTISDNIYANVEEYNTKLIKDAKFETHDKYIDIQILISGEESIAISDRETLTELESYNPKKDITFYSDNLNEHFKVTLNGSNFVMIFPHEGHAPQVSIAEQPQKVRKVVVKIKI